MVYDIIVIGSGPAGLTSAIYASRANKKVLVLEKEALGGNITHSPKVENYPGFDVISGLQLADKFADQAMKLNVEFDFYEAKSIKKENNLFVVDCGIKSFSSLSVIIATGSKHRTLKLDNEENLVGHGISYCAVCDGPFYKGYDIVVIGGGNSALQEAILLSSYAKSVTIIQNLSFLTGEQALIKTINMTTNIKVIYDTIVVGLIGNNTLEGISLLNQKTNQNYIYDTNCVFVAIGQEANNEAFKEYVTLDDQGFIITNDSCNSNVEGIYVAGDTRSKKIRQIVTATSDGSIAALQAIKYLDNLGRK